MKPLEQGQIRGESLVLVEGGRVTVEIESEAVELEAGPEVEPTGEFRSAAAVHEVQAPVIDLMAFAGDAEWPDMAPTQLVMEPPAQRRSQKQSAAMLPRGSMVAVAADLEQQARRAA
jgi:hypothetical protein